MDMMAMSGGMHKINGKIYDANRIDENVNLGATEIWEFDNSTGDEAHQCTFMEFNFKSFLVLVDETPFFHKKKGGKTPF
jgi:FtsP/CotA-like multicopper oxidase with cupredoxin domain